MISGSLSGALSDELRRAAVQRVMHLARWGAEDRGVVGGWAGAVEGLWFGEDDEHERTVSTLARQHEV